MNASSRAPSFQADTRYQSVIESYYRELNRQGSSQRKPEVLDAIHELLVIGMPLVVDENVLIVDGIHRGKTARIAAADSQNASIIFDDGSSDSVGIEYIERDFLALASKL